MPFQRTRRFHPKVIAEKPGCRKCQEAATPSTKQPAKTGRRVRPSEKIAELCSQLFSDPGKKGTLLGKTIFSEQPPHKKGKNNWWHSTTECLDVFVWGRGKPRLNGSLVRKKPIAVLYLAVIIEGHLSQTHFWGSLLWTHLRTHLRSCKRLRTADASGLHYHSPQTLKGLPGTLGGRASKGIQQNATGAGEALAPLATHEEPLDPGRRNSTVGL